MIAELLIASVMVLVTVSLHAGGLTLLSGIVRRRLRNRAGRLYLHTPRAVVSLVLGLFLLHGLEIWLYALLYWQLGAIPDLRGSVYFSTTSYGAIGYSDHAISPEWRLVGAIEGINGVLLIGWTTAFIVTVMSRLQRRRPHL
ncbi:ion channel [Phenylobacterium sp. SCN 70-31]|uniref:ion channel n=1 Tax=Phenylobacterium sp. SCN 70-31 TaxID=1660129 RepID=UPI00086AB74D|nr:ion channel [Phenylobacterium sp. SCN 70-31]ODT89588.1 MAG: transporter [Phenylobacterium sp. SCN 70-31]